MLSMLKRFIKSTQSPMGAILNDFHNKFGNHSISNQHSEYWVTWAGYMHIRQCVVPGDEL
jgi:hypothetical protein